GAIQVRAGVHGFEQPQIILEVVNQRVFEVRNEIGRGDNGAFKTCQALLGHATGSERLIETVAVAVAAQKRQVALANDDVVRSRVVMELLVPFLDETALPFLDVMAVHDVEDVISDALTFPATTQAGQHQPDQVALGRLANVGLRQGKREAVLGMAQIERSGVELALPVKLPNGRKAQPNEQGRPAVALSSNLSDQVMAEVKPVHQRPTVRTGFGLDNGSGQGGQPSGRGVRFGEGNE